MKKRNKERDRSYKREFYHRRHRQLILVLSDGECPICGRTKFLQIEHPKGAGWERRKYSSDYRVVLYWKEFWANVKLTVLCRKCNQRLSNNSKPGQMKLL